MRVRVGLRRVYRALRSREGWRYAWLQLTSPVPVFQDHGTTRLDRYPQLFEFVRKALCGVDRPRLLSFGCATGEEVASLRTYLAQAEITGLDIHAGHIAACQRWLHAHPDSALHFRVAGHTATEADAAYHAIFCLAVMRCGDLADHRGERCDHLIRFQDFDAQLEDFARCLRPGGLLVLRHCNFRLCDARAARWFDAVFTVPTPARSDTPLFGPDNRRLDVDSNDEAVFRRRHVARPS